ncbi:MAG: hypothetical protein Crog4KO_26090 [Crocinitomicaceae bacterium]
MKKMKPLIVDKRDKVNGLYAYCGKCKMLIENRICGKTGKRLSSCDNTESHMFKAILTVPNTNGKRRKTKRIKTRDLNEAILEKIAFENELVSNDYQKSEVLKIEKRENPVLLIECMTLYIDFLNNVGVESHMIKVRTKKHLWEVDNFFKKFCLALKHNGIDHLLLRVDQLNDRIVSFLHEYILGNLKHSNKTYNKMFALYRQFIDWLNRDKGYSIDNPFMRVQRRVEARNKTILSKTEFELLLKVIVPENRWQIFPSGERKNRYKPWLSDCFRLALETGLRREEFMQIRFENIVCDDSGQPLLIEVPNFKVNRIKGEDFSESVKYVPVTEGLSVLLTELGFDLYKGTSRFLIGNDEGMSRATMIDFVSKAFSHFWGKTKIQKGVNLKHLRKTYLTALVENLGDKASVISDHSSMEVLKKHYVNDQKLVAAARNFSVFNK